MNDYENDYRHLLEKVREFGEYRPSRAGETIGLFGEMLKISTLRYGKFPVLTTRKMFVRPIAAELECFLKGTQWLEDFKNAGCNYWDANAKAWWRNQGDPTKEMSLGRIYGVQWRRWLSDVAEHDQIEALIDGLTKDEYGRRHVVTAWRPDELGEMCLPPCHIMFQCYMGVDGHLSMTIYMRSVDLCIGLPADVVLYATLLALIANEVRAKPGDLIFMLGDTHIYTNHLSKWIEQARRTPGDLPTYTLNSLTTAFVADQLQLHDYNPQEAIKYEFNL